MNPHTHITYKLNGQWQRALLCTAMLLAAMLLHARLEERYTKDRPVVIVANQDFPPYEYIHKGQPQGYFVDIVKALMDKAHIPYHITLKEGYQQAYMFDHGEADLIISPGVDFNNRTYYSSRSILDYYKLKIAHSRNMPDVKTIDDLSRLESLVVGKHDYIGKELVTATCPDLQLTEGTPLEELASIGAGSNHYFLWGEEALKWSINNEKLQDVVAISEFSLLGSEFRFFSHDKELIDLIDDSYARMDQSGQLRQLRNKWFHPEIAHNSLPYTVLFITILVTLFVCALIYINRSLSKRIAIADRQSEELHQMMQLALRQGNYSVMEYDVTTSQVVNVHGNMLPDEGVQFSEILTHVHPDDIPAVKAMLRELMKGEKTICELNARWNGLGDTAPAAGWKFIHGHLLAEKDRTGQVRYIVSALKDVTKEHEEEASEQELANRFMKIFDTTLVAMSFYNKDGKLIGLNANMRKLSGYDEESEDSFFHQTSLFDVPLLQGDFDPDSPHYLHACQHMLYPELGIDKYIEFRLLPTYENGELLYYVMTARDITDEREIYLKLYQKETELKLTNAKRNQYEQELRYFLENSNMWVWRSYLSEKVIHFSRTLQRNEYTETFTEFIDSIYEEQREEALTVFNHMKGTDANFNITLHLKSIPSNPVPQWLAISGIAIYDKQGKLEGHFGIIRDVSELMETQEKLRLETNRAEDSGKLKSVFLANMTHEIRTPLNAIVGFSDLLQVIDNPEERREFMRIIRNNCDMLMRLINDIIEASNMNQGPLSIEADDVDFAVAFNDICQTLAQRVQEPGVQFLVDNPYQTFKTHLDKGRLQQVITNFTTNAVKYTHQGHIKVGFSRQTNVRSDNGETSDGIYMYCEDTGAGIPKDKQAAVFERFVKLNDFVQGTGLGLSICKSIADRCGGLIGVSSEGADTGSTFWIWVPCEITSAS